MLQAVKLTKTFANFTAYCFLEYLSEYYSY